MKLLDQKNFTLDIYGSYTKNLENLFEELPENINFQGKKSNTELLQILHQYDIFLFSDQSACPNSVLEAMAAGLPVVAFNRGSIPELIKPGYNGEIAEIKKNSDPFTDAFPFNAESYKNFSEKISKVNTNISDYSKNSQSISTLNFNLQKSITAYTNLIQ